MRSVIAEDELLLLRIRQSSILKKNVIKRGSIKTP